MDRIPMGLSILILARGDALRMSVSVGTLQRNIYFLGSFHVRDTRSGVSQVPAVRPLPGKEHPARRSILSNSGSHLSLQDFDRGAGKALSL
jgi:hypothetical protein